MAFNGVPLSRIFYFFSLSLSLRELRKLGENENRVDVESGE